MKENKNLAYVAVNKSRVKSYSSNYNDDRTVYLDNDMEFQIEFFNSHKYAIGVKISFNGIEDDNILVLRPGERVWLDRYLDSPKKFLFSTYKVENSDEAKEAIRNNGDIIIKYYKEKLPEDCKFNIYDYQYRPSSGWWEPSTWEAHLLSTDNPYVGSEAYTISNKPCSITNYYQPSEYCTSVQTSFNASQNIETGRIERGSHSKQKFNDINMKFEFSPFETEVIKILPKSQKPITSQDLKKRFCYNCGRKIKDKFKFCPNCGAKQ